MSGGGAVTRYPDILLSCHLSWTIQIPNLRIFLPSVFHPQECSADYPQTVQITSKYCVNEKKGFCLLTNWTNKHWKYFINIKNTVLGLKDMNLFQYKSSKNTSAAIYGIRKEQFSGYSITKRYVNSSKYVGISVITFFHLYLRYKKLA